jgi:Cell wall hydrolyses involved in spore germination
MKKVIASFCLSLTLALMLGVYSQAQTQQPESNGTNTAQEEYLLPGPDELNQTEEQDSDTAETTAETAVQTPTVTPAESVSATAINNGGPYISFNGIVSNTVIPLMINDTTYVPFRAFCVTAVNGAVISWSAEKNISYCNSAGLEIDAPFDQSYIIANGRVLYRNEANISINDTLYVPVRSLAAAIGAQVEWNEAAQCVNLTLTGTPITPAEQFYNQTDLLWLARIINAESRYEQLLGKIAVGNVIMNRVADPDFPDTVYDVIFDCRYSVQFYPVTSPVIYNTPSEDSIIAAKACLEGFTVSNSILYFMNPKLAVSTWISRNRSFLFAIGNHSFYA